jgi:hypothetical protein
MSDIDFKITTSAELSGAKSVEAQLERDIGRAKMLGKDFTELEARLQRVRVVMANFDGSAHWTDKLSASVHRVTDAIPGFERFKSVVTELASGPLGAVAAGFTAVGSAIMYARHAVHEFMGAQEVIAKFDAALAQTGQLTEEAREQFQALAEVLQNETTVSGEAWIAVMTKLVQQGVRTDDLERYAQGVKNLAGIMGGDIETAAHVMTRAMNGNMGFLRRYGITVDETASQAKQLDQVFQQLAQRGGGQMEVTARTLSGQWRSFKNDLDDISKGVGNFIAETGVLQGTAGMLKTSFEWIRHATGGTIAAMPGLKNNFGDLAESMGAATERAERFKAYLEGIATEASKAVSAMEALASEIQAVADAQAEQLENEKRIALAKFEAGAGERSEAQNIAGRAAIESQFESSKAGITTEAMRKRLALQRDQHDRMVMEQTDTADRVAALKLEAARVREASGDKTTEDLAVERVGLQRESASSRSQLAQLLARFESRMDGQEDPEYFAAKRKGAPALMRYFQNRAHTLQPLAGSNVDAITTLAALTPGGAGPLMSRQLGGMTGEQAHSEASGAAGLLGTIVSQDRRLTQIGFVESRGKAIAEESQTLEALQKGYAAIFAQLQRSMAALERQIASAEGKEKTRAEVAGIKTASEIAEAKRRERETTLKTRVQRIDNAMEQDLPPEDFWRDGKPVRGRINLMRDRADIQAELLRMGTGTTKNRQENELIDEQIRGIYKKLQEDIQKVTEERRFYDPTTGRRYVPQTRGETPDVSSLNTSVSEIGDTAQALASAAKRINSGLAPVEEAIALMAEIEGRLATVEQQVRNSRPS